MALFLTMLGLHVLGATVWTGGHLVLALSVLPKALKARAIDDLVRFEDAFERVGIPALVVQVVTGLWLANRLLPVEHWLSLGNPLARVVLFKLSCLLLTALLAVDARLRLIPTLTAARLPALAGHIIPVTVLSVLFALAGVSLRVGGF